MNNLHKEFCYLKEVNDTIIEEIRYARYHNFVGRPIAGYLASKCIVSKPMASLLDDAQKLALKDGYTLKIYDTYRPLKASIDMYKWGLNLDDTLMKEEFYKHMDKSSLFNGYIALRSAHTRGAAVDLTLVPLVNGAPPQQDIYKPGDNLYDSISPKEKRFNDNSIDMGTGFDCFHEFSHTDSPSISIAQKANRKKLCDIMQKVGLVNYSKEWWHFNFPAGEEPFPNTYFDFDIT